MMLKKPKEDVLREIQSRALSASMNSLNSSTGLEIRMESMIYQIQTSIAAAVTEGFKVLIENQYSDEMFENDIGLKP